MKSNKWTDIGEARGNANWLTIHVYFDREPLVRTFVFVATEIRDKRFPFLPQGFAVGFSGISNAFDVGFDGGCEYFQIFQGILSRNFARAKSQTVAPLLQIRNSSVFHVGKARGAAIAVGLTYQQDDSEIHVNG